MDGACVAKPPTNAPTMAPQITLKCDYCSAASSTTPLAIAAIVAAVASLMLVVVAL